MSNAHSGTAGGGVQSVDRAITVLEVLARTGEAGVTEVAKEIGVHKSTASRLLAALQSRGLVEVGSDRGRYRLGFGILRLAGAAGHRLDVTVQGREVGEELAQQVGETVNLAVLREGLAVNVYQAQGGRAVSADNWLGRPTPLHATSSGKVLLAYAEDQTLARRIDLTRFTPATITDQDTLLAQLEEVRGRGYALTLEEYEVGLDAVSAPVRTVGGTVVAALSISGPAYRMPAEDLDVPARAVIEAAARISERMGYFG